MTTRIIIRTTEQARAYLADRGVLDRLTLEGDRVVESAACTRCGGSGNGGWFQDGGICYDCRGADTRHRVRKTSLVAYARTERRRETAAARKAAARAERHGARLERQRDWSEAQGHGRLTFDELDEKREQERKARAAASEHIGEVGKRIELTVRYERTHSWDGLYGPTQLVRFDHEGSALVWKTSGWLPGVDVAHVDGWEAQRPMPEGAVLRIRATVKKHDEYRGGRQTVLTRVKVLEVVSRPRFDDEADAESDDSEGEKVAA
jgi:hypothetical protein